MFTKKLSIITALAAVFMLVFLGGPVAAQEQTIEELKDKSVRNEQGEEIGTIQEVIASPDGEIEAVIIRKGGFMGLGGEEERISWNDLQQGQEEDYLVYSPGAQTGEQAESGQYQTTDRQDQASMEQRRQEQAEGRQAREESESGEIEVRQPAPQVKVDQPEPQVQVEQPSPQVRVEQPEPQVIVRQPEPEITVQVEQPEPEVEVRQQQPQVDVRQQEPKVSVSQPEPQVDVQQQEPEVTVEKSEPQVQVGRTGQPEVYMERQGQAQVQVERQGEPQVNVVRKEDESRQQGSLERVEASKAQDWVGRQIAGKDGEELGTVESNYLSEDGNQVLYVIVQGEEDKMHPIPAGMVKEAEDKEELTAEIDKSTFDQSPSFSANEQPELNEQQWSQEIRSYYQNEGEGASQQQRQQQGSRSGVQQNQGERSGQQKQQ